MAIGLLLLTSLGARAADFLRLYGTNTIVDFTLARAAGPQSAYSNYWLVGTYIGRSSNVVVVAEHANFKVKWPPAAFVRASTPRILPIIEYQYYTVLRYEDAQRFPPNQYEVGNFVRREPLIIYVDLIGIRMGKIIPLGQPARPAQLGFDCGIIFTNTVTAKYTVLIAAPKGLFKCPNWKPSQLSR